MADAQSIVVADGKYYWQLIFDYDNSGNPGEIKQTYNYKKKKSVTAKQFLSSKFHINTSYTYNNKANASVRFEGIGDVGGSTEFNFHIDTAYELQKSSETSVTIDEEVTQSREYVVGPQGKLKLYQLCYSTDGVQVQTDTFATNPRPDTIVKLRFSCQQYILGLEELLERLVRTYPAEHNKDEWALIRGNIINDIALPMSTRFRYLVETLQGIKPGSQNIDEWKSIRATCQQILADWDKIDKQLLFKKLLQRLATIHPGSSNTLEWKAIREVCDKILTGLKENY